MVLSAKALLNKKPRASREEIKQALSGVLCRCGSYQKILEAVQAVSEGIDDGA
jgi:aerobic-type carbon monoxide dehydrogenase small subunit (CoxS/CutS family)